MALIQNLRLAARMLRRSPGFTAVAVLVLGLGIGANTAIFSMVNAVLLEPLPFQNPQQLVQMFETESAPGNFPLSGPDFPDWKAQSQLFADMTLYNYPRSLNLNSGGRPDRVIGVPAAANFFQILGVRAALGRTFLPGEDQAGKNHLVVLGHALWESRFGGNPALLGRSISLDGEAYTVIGVAPASFRLQPAVELWTGLDMSPAALGQRGNHSYSAIGRLKPGVSLAAAGAEMSAIAARLGRRFPGSNADTGVHLFRLRDRLVGASQRTSLLTLLAVVGLVLLIACADVANLLLARALSRQKEMAIRLALGAGRGQLLRQLLTESVLLALAGAALGAGLAELGVRGVTRLAAFGLPQFNVIQVNGPVLAFTIGLALGCGILFGLAPALQLSRPRLSGELAGAGTLAGGSRRRRWLGDGLIVGEIALSLILVVAAGLFVQSFLRLRASHLGVNARHLLTASVTAPDAAYPTPARKASFTRALLARVRAIPGVQSAAVSSELPLEGGSNGYITLPGEASAPQALVEWTWISDDYFATMGIPLLAGQDYSAAGRQAWEHFDANPAKGISLPVIVNQAMARHFYPGKSPIGQQFRQGSDGPLLTIQGIAGNVAIGQLGDDGSMPQAYFPEDALGAQHLEVRSQLPVDGLSANLRQALASVDASLPLYNIRTMEAVADQSVSGQAFQEWLVTAFALLALLLAAAGIYGVMACLVAARTREIGVRMALGASPAAVAGLVLGQGLRLAAAGIGLGLAGALLAGRLIASQLYQVRSTDPATLMAASALLLLASGLASYLPARRAAHVDPNQALRCS